MLGEDRGCKEPRRHVDKICGYWKIGVMQNLGWSSVVVSTDVAVR